MVSGMVKMTLYPRAAAIQAPYRQLEGAYLRLAEKLSIYAREAQAETKDT